MAHDVTFGDHWADLRPGGLRNRDRFAIGRAEIAGLQFSQKLGRVTAEVAAAQAASTPDEIVAASERVSAITWDDEELAVLEHGLVVKIQAWVVDWSLGDLDADTILDAPGDFTDAIGAAIDERSKPAEFGPDGATDPASPTVPSGGSEPVSRDAKPTSTRRRSSGGTNTATGG